MTAGVLDRGTVVPTSARRSPYSYRVTSIKTSSYVTTRILGLWVPAEAFRRQTVIMWEGISSTNSTVFNLSIGGNALARGTGTAIQPTTGPAATTGFRVSLTQLTDGPAPTFRTSGFYSGATSLAVATGATASVFLQPLNFVELSTSGTFTIDECSLEVIPGQRTAQFGWQEIMAT